MAYLSELLSGLTVTLELTVLSLLLGGLLALVLTWTLDRRVPMASQLVEVFLVCFTGTPLLVQIFLIYYGPAQFDWVKASPLWSLLKEPWFCAVLALALIRPRILPVCSKGPWMRCRVVKFWLARHWA